MIRIPKNDVSDSHRIATQTPDPPVAPRHTLPRSLRLNAVVNAVRTGKHVTDPRFDAIYPERVRVFSWRYWTPVEVARRAAQLLVSSDSTRVLDIGSGAGKFCLVGALATRGTFTGIEHRRHLVEVAQWVAERYRAPRAEYRHGDMREVDWRAFDAFYFFNPFGEHVFDADERLDALVDLTPERAESDRAFVLAALERAPVGTRVATYYGLGCDLPESYDRIQREPAGPGVLDLWVRARG